MFVVHTADGQEDHLQLSSIVSVSYRHDFIAEESEPSLGRWIENFVR